MGCGGLGVVTKPNLSAGKYKGPKSSNGIEVMNELNYLYSFKFYCIFSDLRPTGSCGCAFVWGCPHMHAHAHVCNAKIYMYRNCKWLPPWRYPCSSCLTCMYVCAHAHVCGVAPTHPRISKNSIILEQIEIFQFCLKI